MAKLYSTSRSPLTAADLWLFSSPNAQFSEFFFARYARDLLLYQVFIETWPTHTNKNVNRLSMISLPTHLLDKIHAPPQDESWNRHYIRHYIRLLRIGPLHTRYKRNPPMNKAGIPFTRERDIQVFHSRVSATCRYSIHAWARHSGIPFTRERDMQIIEWNLKRVVWFFMDTLFHSSF